ncbi:coiled-coil domain-containing protein [Candidatus Methanoperedens nitratireducens]|uniref:Tubulin like n=1 Tax=Candidatus Methanoperedens nitratireducens TaxID=1392998 RepID=A0A284VKN4_9EURY|nr:tubulin-like doman-containing protein [Candidatus Methanoperedens nitroreducens]SNQ59769.1 hypothetical protein MNV_1330003 [Candidatus Methanoperedens nitroreducens]
MPEIQNMSFPRYIFAIGGAGKDLIYTTLEKEWILREIIKPKFTATTVDVRIIDTAIDEENNDLERIQRINKSIDKIGEEYRSDPNSANKNVGRINISYSLLTKEMTLQSPYDLIGIEQNVKKATGASIWWINDPQLGDDWYKKVINRENFKELNFSKGVYRKRAIGKAIYYKALSQGLFDIDLPLTAQVDIIVGLGGGTGSGMAFDLATKLKTIQPTSDITLFGILSTLDESPDEKANNFAMISELEHGYLNKDTPFKNVVLIPMEVTRYPGKEKASDEHERLLREFDETIPYIFVAWYNNPGQLFFSNLPEYAPFVIATSQIVRYNVESIKKLKDKVIESLQDKDISLKNEEEMYTNIKKFISDFSFIRNIGLPDEDKSFIRERLSRFDLVLEPDEKSVSAANFFKDLDYNSIIHLKKAVDDGIKGTESDDVEKQITSIKSETDTISIEDKSFRDDVDSTLYKILKKDVEIIEIMKNVLNMANNFPEDIVKDTLKVMIKADEYRLGRQLNKTRDEIDSLNGKRRTLDGTIRSVQDDIKNYKDKVENELDKNRRIWQQNEVKNITHLDLLDDSISPIGNDFALLKDNLVEFINNINSRSSIRDIDNEPVRNIESIADKIYQKLDNIGIYFEDKNVILRSLANAKELKKAQIELKKGIPALDRMIGIVTETGRIKRNRDLRKKIDLKIAELNNDKVFGVKTTGKISTMDCVYDFDVKQIIDQKKDDIISKIINMTRETFPNAESLLFENLIITLKDPVKRRDVNIDDIIKSNLGYDADITKLQNNLQNYSIEWDQIVKKAEMINNLEKLLKNNTPVLRRHSEHMKKYHDNMINIGKDVQAMSRAEKDVIRYIMDIQPTNIFRATVTGANINNILEDKSESLVLKQNLQDGIEREIDNRYNILVRRVIESQDNTKRWDKTKLMNLFVTLANVSPSDIDSKVAVTNSFSIDKENYSEWKCPWGDTWGVGLVLFVAGVPFDNVRNITDPRAGYYQYYNIVEKNGAAFFHHSYLLDKGKFIRRKKIFNIEDENNKQLLLQSDKDIKSLYYQNYEEIDIKNSL